MPGFNATLDRHGIAIPFTSLIDVPLPVRTALLAGLAVVWEEANVAIPAIWHVTSGMHRTHLGFVLTDLARAIQFCRSGLGVIGGGLT